MTYRPECIAFIPPIFNEMLKNEMLNNHFKKFPTLKCSEKDSIFPYTLEKYLTISSGVWTFETFHWLILVRFHTSIPHIQALW